MWWTTRYIFGRGPLLTEKQVKVEEKLRFVAAQACTAPRVICGVYADLVDDLEKQGSLALKLKPRAVSFRVSYVEPYPDRQQAPGPRYVHMEPPTASLAGRVIGLAGFY